MTGEMAVMTAADGDFRITWDSDKPEEVSHAQATFNKFRGQGYLAYKVNAKGDKGEVLQSFDSTAEKVILAPRMIGG